MLSRFPRHVYIHVPFCARRCSYCDFSIAVRRDVPVDDYLDSLETELALRFGNEERSEVDTIYFGGGTPSRLGGEGLARALELVQRRFAPAQQAEIERYSQEVEPLLRGGATVELDGRRPAGELADAVERLLVATS